MKELEESVIFEEALDFYRNERVEDPELSSSDLLVEDPELLTCAPYDKGAELLNSKLRVGNQKLIKASDTFLPDEFNKSLSKENHSRVDSDGLSKMKSQRLSTPKKRKIKENNETQLVSVKKVPHFLHDCIIRIFVFNAV